MMEENIAFIKVASINIMSIQIKDSVTNQWIITLWHSKWKSVVVLRDSHPYSKLRDAD